MAQRVNNVMSIAWRTRTAAFPGAIRVPGGGTKGGGLYERWAAALDGGHEFTDGLLLGPLLASSLCTADVR